MRAKHMTITLTSGHKTLVLGKGQPYRLRSVQGLEAAPITIASAANAGMNGATVTNARLEGWPGFFRRMRKAYAPLITAEQSGRSDTG